MHAIAVEFWCVRSKVGVYPGLSVIVAAPTAGEAFTTASTHLLGLHAPGDSQWVAAWVTDRDRWDVEQITLPFVLEG